MNHVKSFLFILFIVLFFPCFISAEIQYGAFDPAYWNGLVMLKDNNAFAFRFIIHKNNDKADGYDTFHIVEHVGPFAPDGNYAEVSFNPSLPFHKGKDTPILKKNAPPSSLVTMRYTKLQDGIAGCVSIPVDSGIETLFYTPWEPTVAYRLENNIISGVNNSLVFNFIPIGSAFEKVEIKEKELSGMVGANVRAFYFYAGFDKPTLTNRKIEEMLETNKKEYSALRPQVSGQWQGLIASITNNLAWMKLYQPDKKRIYLPAGRRWIFPKPDGTQDLWTIFEWDAFFNALEASVEDKELARLEIEAVLDAQYDTGNIPNWRSAHSGSPDRAQPPVGAFAVLKIYYRLNDITILANAYDRLKKFHQYWTAPAINGNPRRDGNSDGLLEWGSDTDKLFEGMPEWEKGVSGTQRAAWESGEDDLPNYDNVPFDEKTGTLTLNCIDLSSLYALDAEMMMRIAGLLGKKEDAEIFKKEYETIKEKINQHLWNQDFYYDRYWDGVYSTHKAASNFYPLIAGIPEEERVKKLLEHLSSAKEFWGDYVLPTISRDNPAFKDQQYWRGTIWPPTNYLVYQGLKRYGLDEVAAEFAVKSATLFLNSWLNFGLCRENYNSVTGEGGGQRYQSWGPLFALILLEDFIDISPFDGFRVGNLAASQMNKIENIRFRGEGYTLEADKDGMELCKGESKLFKYKGKAVLRRVEVTDEVIEFEAHVVGDFMDFYPTVFSGKDFKVKVDGGQAVKMKSFVRVPRGVVKVLVEKSPRIRRINAN